MNKIVFAILFIVFFFTSSICEAKITDLILDFDTVKAKIKSTLPKRKKQEKIKMVETVDEWKNEAQNIPLIDREIKEEKPKNKDLELDDLYQRLKTWRKTKAEEEKLPAFWIFTNTTLEEIVKKHPKTKEDLLKVKGFGQKKFEKYGQAILEIVLED
jgi:superfamily II DNA helicase RecQ